MWTSLPRFCPRCQRPRPPDIEANIFECPERMAIGSFADRRPWSVFMPERTTDETVSRKVWFTPVQRPFCCLAPNV